MTRAAAPDQPCPICQETANSWLEVPSRDSSGFTCRRCGEFLITGSAYAVFRGKTLSPKQISNASGWVREHSGIELSTLDVEYLTTLRSPSVAERAQKILLELEKRSNEIGLQFNFDFNSGDNAEWRGVSWSVNDAEVEYLVVQCLIEGGFVSGKHTRTLGAVSFVHQASITPKGYEFLQSLRQYGSESEIGFGAMWFTSEMDPLWVHGIEPAIRLAGYVPVRIDKHEHNNRIDDEIIAMIRRSRFIIADFTGQRGGVYFESGFALGLGLRVIWTCKESDLNQVHFDNRQYNFLTWTQDKLNEFAQQLQNRIEATIGHGSYRRVMESG